MIKDLWDKLDEKQRYLVIGAGAIVLGPITIGNDSRIGSSSVVIHDVPSHSTVVGIPGKVVHRREPIVTENGEHHYDLQHGTLPDPFGETIDALRSRIDALSRRIDFLEKQER